MIQFVHSWYCLVIDITNYRQNLDFIQVKLVCASFIEIFCLIDIIPQFYYYYICDRFSFFFFFFFFFFVFLVFIIDPIIQIYQLPALALIMFAFFKVNLLNPSLSCIIIKVIDTIPVINLVMIP